jgi:multidrug efflux pump
VGRAGGFNLVIEDRGDNGPVALQTYVDAMVQNKPPVITSLFSAFRANVPQFYADVNRSECMTKEVDLQSLFETLRVYLGSLYVNDFNRFGRTWQVIVQADAAFRAHAPDIKRLKVRNVHGTMIPVATLADFREKPGPLILTRYNMYPAATINGNAMPGVSSGRAMNAMEDLAKASLPPSMTSEWTELAFFEKQAGNTAGFIFVLAVVMVFLVLAAQYESWALPLAVILVVPMCLLCGIAGVWLGKEDINIFTQIGFVVLVGLASKNAILIVEFAKYHRDAGESRWQATVEACRLRLRPIMMTSLAFILGVFPLLLGSGAGAEMRRTLGTTVFSGMVGVTLFGIFLTPVFFYVIDWMSEARLWKSAPFRWMNTIVLGTLSLHPVRQLVRRTLQPPTRQATAPEPLDEITFGPEHESDGEREPLAAGIGAPGESK